MRIFILFITISLFSLFVSCHKGKNNSDSCNGKSTRREIKLAIDDAASEINTIPILTNVDSIGDIAVIKVDKDTKRQEIEKKVFTITAKVHKLSKHWDGDWKVKLTDGNDKFINCESPNYECEFASSSIFYNEFKTVRNWIQSNKDGLEGKIVTVTGVAFIDLDHHYPRDAAENELELHPILDIHF